VALARALAPEPRLLLLVLMARELLRDPYWPLHAADALHDVTSWAPQYMRATSRKSPQRPNVDYSGK